MSKKPQAFEVIQPSRACGGCTACCTALFVEALQKPALTACEHAQGGCGIYEHRPMECRAFECGWRFRLPALGLEDGDRPDRSGLVPWIGNPAFGALTLHAAWPGSTQEPAAQELIGRLAQRGIAFVIMEGANVEGVFAPDSAHPLIAHVEKLIESEKHVTPERRGE